MGQQQLLLLVLGVVLVGLAVVAGFDTFTEAKKKADLDRYTVEAMRMAVGAIAWRETPQSLGGGQGGPSFERLSLGQLGFSNIIASSYRYEISYENNNYYGIYHREDGSTHPNVIVGSPNFDLHASVFLHGPGPECLVTRIGWRDSDGTQTFVPEALPPRPAGCTGW